MALIFPLLSLALVFSFHAKANANETPELSLAEARANFVASQKRLAQLGERWRAANAELKKMASCGLNPNRENDLALIRTNEARVNQAAFRTEGAFKKLDEGGELFGGKIEAKICDAGGLDKKLDEYDRLAAFQQQQLFPKDGKGEMEKAIEQAAAALAKSTAEYRAHGCGQGFSLWCSGARSCAGGQDPGQLYSNAKAQMEAVKRALLGATEKKPESVKVSMAKLRETLAKEKLKLAQIPKSCNSAPSSLAEASPR